MSTEKQYLLKQTCTFKLSVCLSMYDLFFGHQALKVKIKQQTHNNKLIEQQVFPKSTRHFVSREIFSQRSMMEKNSYELLSVNWDFFQKKPLDIDIWCTPLLSYYFVMPQRSSWRPEVKTRVNCEMDKFVFLFSFHSAKDIKLTWCMLFFFLS